MKYEFDLSVSVQRRGEAPGVEVASGGQGSTAVDQEKQDVSDRLASLKMRLQASRSRGVPVAPLESVKTTTQKIDDVSLESEAPSSSGLNKESEMEEKVRHLTDLYESQRIEYERSMKESERRIASLMEEMEVTRRKDAEVIGQLRQERDRLQGELEAMARSRDDVGESLQKQMKKQELLLESLQTSKKESLQGATVLQELDQTRDALTKSNAELKFAKDQLQRLKSQMIVSQEEEEEQLRWRVDAEVKLQLERLGLGPDGKPLAAQDGQLLQDLEVALEKVQEAELESKKWRDALVVKETEAANMQRALEDLQFESDTAENLRVQVRSLELKIQSMKAELEESKLNCSKHEEQARKAVEQAAEEKAKTRHAKDAEGAARQEMISLQVAYNDLANQMKAADNKTSFQREFIVDLMKDMSSMRHSQAMKKAADTLTLTEAERKYIWGDPSASLANTWVTFLESQVNESYN